MQGRFAKVGAPELELETLETLARAQLTRGQTRQALLTSQLALDQLKALRLVSGNPEMRARLNDVYRSVHELRVELLLARVSDAAPGERNQILAQVCRG